MAVCVASGVLVRDGNLVRVALSIGTDVDVPVDVGGSVLTAAVTWVGEGGRTLVLVGNIRVGSGVLVRVDTCGCAGREVAVCGNRAVDAESGIEVESGVPGSVFGCVGRGTAVEGIG
jgi:hypothetical protein